MNAQLMNNYDVAPGRIYHLNEEERSAWWYMFALTIPGDFWSFNKMEKWGF